MANQSEQTEHWCILVENPPAMITLTLEILELGLRTG